MKASTARTTLTGSLLLASMWIVFVASMDRTINPYDEGIILTGAMRVAAGAVPHRDFYANYGPGQFYLIAALFKLFHPAAFVARLWGELVKSMLVLVTYRAAIHVTTKRRSILSAVVIAVWLSVADMSAWPAWTSLLLCLLGVLCLMNSIQGVNPQPRICAAGVLLGVAGLFRYDIAVLVFAAETAWLLSRSAVHINRESKASWLRTFLDIRWLLAGTALIILPLLLVYALDGVLGDFYFDVVQFQSKNYIATRGLPFPALEDISIPALWSDYAVYFPPLVCVAALATIAGDWRSALGGVTNPSEQPTRCWCRLLVILVTLAFMTKGIVRVSIIHMAPAMVMASIVAPTLKFSRRSPVVTGLTAVAWMAIAAPTLVAVFQVVDHIQGNYSDFLRDRSGDSVAESIAGYDRRTRYLRLDFDEARAAEFVLTHTMPNDTIFSGLSRHDRVFANDVALYFLTDRQPATKWYHFDPRLQTGADIQAAIIKDFSRAKPKLVIRNSRWDAWREPNASSESSGIQLLDQFIEEHYTTVARFGSTEIAELRSKLRPE